MRIVREALSADLEKIEMHVGALRKVSAAVGE
jgi:hypothetical protein